KVFFSKRLPDQEWPGREPIILACLIQDGAIPGRCQNRGLKKPGGVPCRRVQGVTQPRAAKRPTGGADAHKNCRGISFFSLSESPGEWPADRLSTLPGLASIPGLLLPDASRARFPRLQPRVNRNVAATY
ncbi:MAG: hypothetical protein Q8J78_17290, partial [Moraxellaceae bacterium]|nr:hypothetical protein [Moraxellaceae bacterium]